MSPAPGTAAGSPGFDPELPTGVGAGRPGSAPGGRGSSLFADWSPLRRDPGFRSQWLGQLGSAIGRETARYAFPIQIYLTTGSLALLGVVAVLQLVATVFLSLSGGALADLFDRRVILLGALVVMAAASAGLLALSLLEQPPLELVIALGVVVTTFFTMEQPARLSAVPRLVPRERLPAAIALTSLNFQALSVAGPALAALMFGVAGLSAAYLLQVVGYVWAVLASAWMPPLPPASRVARSPIRMIAEGFSFVRDRRIILSSFAVDLDAMILALPMGSLLPVLLIEAFGITPEAAGIMMAARGAGAVAGGVFSGWTRSVDAVGRAVIAIVLTYSLATVALGLLTGSFLLGLILIAICGAADVSSAILRNTIIQTATPDDLRGRVTSIHVLSSAGGPRVGDIRAALMAEALGAQGSLIVGGVLAVIGVGVVARGFPELRSYRIRSRRGQPGAPEADSAVDALPPTAEGER